MLSTQLTSTALLNAFYQRTNGLTKDEACLSTTYEKCMPRAAATSEGATTIAAMTKQLTTTTATNAASSITQTANLAPTIISPTSACATTDATSEATQQKKQPATTIVSTTTTSVSSDTSGRSAALERAYVHDVYENCEEPTGPVRPRVAQFLGNLEPGSVVCDVGCGSGRYLTQCNPAICTIGVDRCYRLGKVAHERGGEVTLCDNLELPFRNDSFDAVLSLAVVHHFATTERRVRALRELARILRIGGRVVITVWALEQRHRRFESQDVLIPWQPPKNRNFSYSDEDDEDDFLPPYHAYTEDSTNSSRSAGDGDSSSLSSSSPGESCYSFVRRAIQKLAGGRRHAWFLDSWTSKDTKNNSSLDYEDAKDLPIELRRLEDFDDFSDPPLSASLKSRSLGSILQTPPRQIVRSRSSVPSLGGPLVPSETKASATAALLLAAPEGQLQQNGRSSPTATVSAGSTLSRRPKLIKQKQSLCDEDDSLVQSSEQSHSTEFQMISSYNGSNGGVSSSLYARTGCYASTLNQHASATSTPPTETSDTPAPATMPSFLRKQSSLNEDLMAGNRLREREGVRKRIQKQTSLNEAFLCRSAMFSKRLQIIRDGFTTKIKSSTGSLERVTKTGINKLMQNIKPNPTPPSNPNPQQPINKQSSTPTTQTHPHPHAHPHQHHHHHHLGSNAGGLFSAHLLLSSTSSTGPVSYCSTVDCSAANLCHCSAYQQDCAVCAESEQGNERRHSRESGSDSSKDSSLQSDTSIESEDSFASVIFIPKPEQAQQQLNYQQQHQNSNSSSSNSGSSNGAARAAAGAAAAGAPTITTTTTITTLGARLPHTHTHTHSVPTSPLIMPCPPTPAHSPAANQGTVTSPPQTMSAVTAAMAILTPAAKPERFNFDAAHIKQQQEQQMEQITIPKITRQAIREMPAIPKFRKQQSLQLHRQNFPIVRRASGSGSSSSISTKLLSLELFNPATDDLDSDSSEPSSPDSVDSVISAPRSTQLLSSMSTGTGKSSDDSDSALGQQICHTQDEYLKGEMPINNGTPNENDIILNADSAPLLPDKRDAAGQAQANQQPHDCAEFAEQLTAQLQRELDDKYNRVECRSLDGIGDIGEFLSGGTKKRCNGDLSALRDELRERRLMLANLSTQPSLQHSPNSSSTSSLSSQTRSFTIPEEQEGEEEEDEENERSYTLGIYEHCKISKFKYKRNRHYNLNPETAYLLQEDGDSDVRDDEYHIPEEDEDAEAIEARGGDQLGEGMHEYGQRRRNFSATKSVASSASSSTDTAPSPSQQLPQHPKTLQQRTSTESLEHSNSSTTSLDSPSQGGGATTHHRFYHVFREGELDALINHHVASLHIVSSYYERASWCVVAEKVQVWTI